MFFQLPWYYLYIEIDKKSQGRIKSPYSIFQRKDGLPHCKREGRKLSHQFFFRFLALIFSVFCLFFSSLLWVPRNWLFTRSKKRRNRGRERPLISAWGQSRMHGTAHLDAWAFQIFPLTSVSVFDWLIESDDIATSWIMIEKLSPNSYSTRDHFHSQFVFQNQSFDDWSLKARRDDLRFNWMIGRASLNDTWHNRVLIQSFNPIYLSNL